MQTNLEPITYKSYSTECAYCILAGLDDLVASATNPENHDIYREMVGLEIASSFSFQSGRWLGDVAPHVLNAEMLTGLREAKRRATAREQIEARIPAHLLYTKGWPTVMPTRQEAILLSDVRRSIATLLQFSIEYSDPDTLVARYGELMAINAARGGNMVPHINITPTQESLWEMEGVA